MAIAVVPKPALLKRDGVWPRQRVQAPKTVRVDRFVLRRNVSTVARKAPIVLVVNRVSMGVALKRARAQATWIVEENESASTRPVKIHA